MLAKVLVNVSLTVLLLAVFAFQLFCTRLKRLAACDFVDFAYSMSQRRRSPCVPVYGSVGLFVVPALRLTILSSWPNGACQNDSELFRGHMHWREVAV